MYYNFVFDVMLICNDADLDPEPSSHFDADPGPACHFDADPDPGSACHSDADLDPDPTFHFDAEHCIRDITEIWFNFPFSFPGCSRVRRPSRQ
jgi:hypothetical protein